MAFISTPSSANVATLSTDITYKYVEQSTFIILSYVVHVLIVLLLHDSYNVKFPGSVIFSWFNFTIVSRHRTLEGPSAVLLKVSESDFTSEKTSRVVVLPVVPGAA